MKWKNTDSNFLPGHGMRVLISVEGIYHIAVYNNEQRLFEVEDGQLAFSSDVAGGAVYWTDIHEPNSET
jgi:hypothetical protein